MIVRRYRRARSRRRGATVVEMAVVLPVFFMVILGTIEFGRAFMVAQLLNNAARQGARVAVMNGSTNTEVETEVKDLVSAGTGVDPDRLTVTIEVSPAPGNDDPLDDVSLAQRRDVCQVTVAVAFTDVQYVPGEFLSDVNLVGYALMRHE